MLVAQVEILLAPVPDLPARDLPLRRTRPNRTFTRLTFKLATDRQQVRVCAWQI
jgi:hypothetical protein